MIRTIILIATASFVAFSQDHHAMVNEHGDHAMGFSHEKTTHHFELNYDGGAIEVRANDLRDTRSREEIRSHFRHIVRMFREGNFNVPMLVHDTVVPGTANMTMWKNQLHWKLRQTRRGARIDISADNEPALAAVHDFLRFQIEDHQTGDCPMVH